MDVGDSQLCHALSNLILKVIPYDRSLTHLLIKMVHRTEIHPQIIKYFVGQQDWLQDEIILGYVAALSEDVFTDCFLTHNSYSQLCRLVLTTHLQPRANCLLEVIVDRCNQDNPVDLDVISLMFRVDEVRWEQLERVLPYCPEAADMIIHQFLQSETPE